MQGAAKERLQSQQGANAFVERVLVANHKGTQEKEKRQGLTLLPIPRNLPVLLLTAAHKDGILPDYEFFFKELLRIVVMRY